MRLELAIATHNSSGKGPVARLLRYVRSPPGGRGVRGDHRRLPLQHQDLGALSRPGGPSLQVRRRHPAQGLHRGVSPNEWDRISSNAGTSVQLGEGTRVYMLGMKCSEGNETYDVRVRQAIDYAIDDKTIAEAVLDGSAVQTLTRVANGVVGQDESLYGQYNFDVDKAKQLLDEAGYPRGEDGVRFTGRLAEKFDLNSITLAQ